jgi:hypothetical protein
VPQDDIVHPQLTVREALYFSAKLPTDLKDAEIETRIDKVLNSLEIFDKKTPSSARPNAKCFLAATQTKHCSSASAPAKCHLCRRRVRRAPAEALDFRNGGR